MLKQNARCKWINEDAKKFRFFHSILKSRLSFNGIHALKLGDTIIKDMEGIKNITDNHFKDKFLEPHFNIPMLQGVPFHDFFDSESSGLEKPVSMLELKEIIWNSWG